jgi:hypothetical protein
LKIFSHENGGCAQLLSKNISGEFFGELIQTTEWTLGKIS